LLSSQQGEESRSGELGTLPVVNRSSGHTHKHTDREQHPLHTHDNNNTPTPQTNTPHKHLTTLEGGATTVRATTHATYAYRREGVRGIPEGRGAQGRIPTVPRLLSSQQGEDSRSGELGTLPVVRRETEWDWRAVGLCSPCLRWWGRLCRRRCAAGGCARAVLVWGGLPGVNSKQSSSSKREHQSLVPRVDPWLANIEGGGAVCP